MSLGWLMGCIVDSLPSNDPSSSSRQFPSEDSSIWKNDTFVDAGAVDQKNTDAGDRNQQLQDYIDNHRQYGEK